MFLNLNLYAEKYSPLQDVFEQSVIHSTWYIWYPIDLFYPLLKSRRVRVAWPDLNSFPSCNLFFDFNLFPSCNLIYIVPKPYTRKNIVRFRMYLSTRFIYIFGKYSYKNYENLSWCSNEKYLLMLLWKFVITCLQKIKKSSKFLLGYEFCLSCDQILWS